MNKLSKRHFWNWFRRHNQEYLTLDKKSKKEKVYWFNELNAHLRAYYKFLYFSLDITRNQKATLTISVAGKPEYFKRAEDMVAKAPAIPGWTITALDDPRPMEFLLGQQILDTGIDPGEMSFSFLNDHSDPNGIVIYHPLCTDDNVHKIAGLAKAAIYNLVGERSYGTDIYIQGVTNLSYADPDEVYELQALPFCIGQRPSPMLVNSRGSLVGVD
jgi:hypothetical protein